MGFKSFSSKLILRIAGICVTSFLLTHFLYTDNIVFVPLTAGALVYQAYLLKKWIGATHHTVTEYLNAIQYDDLTNNYDGESNEFIVRLNEAFSKVLRNLKSKRKEQEADYQYLKNIVHHIGIGLITFNETGSVQIINTAAKKLLKVNNISNIRSLEAVSIPLVNTFSRLTTGGRDLVKIEIGGEIVQLAVYAIQLTLRNEQYKLISIQNIQNELEEKEMEAWQNLVRVLTHEIMNSVTPISSLAATVNTELKEQLANGRDVNQITNEEVEELQLAINTIQRRSEGLIRFVSDFRNLTQIPIPKLAKFDIRKMLDEIEVLLKKELRENNISFSIKCDPDPLVLNADQALIEQVLINLLKNAIQAFDEQTNRLIEVTASLNDKSRPMISVKDNGNGIDEEALEKIFIPFFTTKQTGSGIGLSLSKQIMRQHQGTMAVKSKMDEGTEFILRF
jgi:nitrogen fixation/metabolism regulation signal transduction histidine kinase